MLGAPGRSVHTAVKGRIGRNPEDPSPYVARMRKKILIPVLVALCALIALGCTDNKEETMPTPAELSGALLSITDMEGSWNETQRQVFTTREAENPSIDPSVWCPQAAESSKDLVNLAGQSGADVEMSLAGEQDVRRMMRLQAWSNADVQDYFDELSKAVDDCNGRTTVDGDGITTTAAVITGRELGDESVSWSQRIVPPSGKDKVFDSVGRTTVARFGDVIMVLQIGDAVASGAANPLTEDEWWGIVETAGRKIENLG